MTQTEAKKPVPPYTPYKTLVNLAHGWSAHLPSRIDRSVLGNYSGGAQSAIISALRYLNLITADGVPTDSLERLVRSEGGERQKELQRILRTSYPFMFAQGFDITKATPAQINERFAETGATGETLSKCLSFFTGMTKDAGIDLTPHLRTRQRRAPNSRKRNEKKPGTPAPRDPQYQDRPTQTPLQVLIGMLDPAAMDDAEQQAVWTLIKFLKRQEG